MLGHTPTRAQHHELTGGARSDPLGTLTLKPCAQSHKASQSTGQLLPEGEGWEGKDDMAGRAHQGHLNGIKGCSRSASVTQRLGRPQRGRLVLFSQRLPTPALLPGTRASSQRALMSRM